MSGTGPAVLWWKPIRKKITTRKRQDEFIMEGRWRWPAWAPQAPAHVKTLRALMFLWSDGPSPHTHCLLYSRVPAAQHNILQTVLLCCFVIIAHHMTSSSSILFVFFSNSPTSYITFLHFMFLYCNSPSHPITLSSPSPCPPLPTRAQRPAVQ